MKPYRRNVANDNVRQGVDNNDWAIAWVIVAAALFVALCVKAFT